MKLWFSIILQILLRPGFFKMALGYSVDLDSSSFPSSWINFKVSRKILTKMVLDCASVTSTWDTSPSYHKRAHLPDFLLSCLIFSRSTWRHPHLLKKNPFPSVHFCGCILPWGLCLPFYNFFVLPFGFPI